MGKTVAGTTDEVSEEIVQHPIAKDSEVKFILDEIQAHSKNLKDFVKEDEDLVSSKWCGLRPLVLDDKAMADDKLYKKNGKLKGDISTKFLTRSHIIEESTSGLISIMGGKWTTFRIMGQETTDKAMKQMLKKQLITNEEYNEYKKRESGDLRLIGDFRKKYPTTLKVFFLV